MNDAELDALVARLREWADCHSFSRPVRDAADAITALRQERDAESDALFQCRALLRDRVVMCGEMKEQMEQLRQERDAKDVTLGEMTMLARKAERERDAALAENEKLRALLQESREWHHVHHDDPIEFVELCNRIDAALHREET
jgi:hypothetical protein